MVARLIGLLVAAAIALTMTPSLRAAEFPPQSYTVGTILPDHIDQGARDAALVEFYQQWKAVYLSQDCGPGRYLVRMNADGNPTYGGSAEETLTVSEAHGYGMLITVMMSGADPEAQTIFDGMVAYWKDHPAASDPALLAWNQLENCQDAGADVGGRNTATDGDLDIAYALLLADRVWGSDGAVNYLAEARTIIAAILKHEVSAKGDFLLIGDWAGKDPTYADTTRSSDFMVSHLRAFADATGEARWNTVRDVTYATMEAVRAQFSPDTGLMPDFIVGMPKSPKPAPSQFLEGESDGDYSWNAARYPWRVALDYLLYGDDRARAALAPLTAWAQETTGGDPRKFFDTYRLDGTVPPEHWENALTFTSMLGPAAMLDPANQAWLNAIWDSVLEQSIADDDYFGNTLKLLALITMTGHWLAPVAAQ